MGRWLGKWLFSLTLSTENVITYGNYLGRWFIKAPKHPHVIVKWSLIFHLISHDFCQCFRMLQRLATAELKQVIAKNLWSEITKPLVGEIH